MSNAFSCFWVAEALEPCVSMTKPKDTYYAIFTEEQFSSSKHNGLLRTRKIVGTIALTKSHRLDKGAWIRRLCVHKQYRRKGLGASLLNVAVQFALEQGYSCVNVVASEYTEGGRELCLKKGFELKQMYHKPVVGFLITVLMYELAYQIKPGEGDYVSRYYSKQMLNQ